MTGWIMIGACLVATDCAMPSPSDPFPTKATCLAAADVRHSEHPGSVYDCVLMPMSPDDLHNAVFDLWKRSGGVPQ